VKRVAVAAVGALIVVAAASAHGATRTPAQRPARASETSAIRAAIVGYVRLHSPSIRRFKWYEATVSTADAAWAVVGMDGFTRGGRGVGFAGALVVHTATGPWHVVNFGSSDLGCGAPAKVRRDLKLDCYEGKRWPRANEGLFPLFWKTPGEAAYCRVLGGPARIVCWTPNDGFTVTLYTTRRPEHFYYAGHRDYYKAVRVLPFGYRVSYGAGTIACRSTTGGLTCTNPAGHGFWLGRYHGYRVF